MMLAQTIDAVPAAFWKNLSVALIALVVLACGIIVAWAAIVSVRRGRENNNVNIQNQPVEVRKAPKRYNHEATEQRFTELERRVTLHDEELKSIQEDRARTLRHINSRFERVLVGLSNIAGKVGAKMPNQESEEQ